MAILAAWESRVARCLREAQAAGAIASDASPQALARVLDRLGRRGDARQAGPVCRTA